MGKDVRLGALLVNTLWRDRARLITGAEWMVSLAIWQTPGKVESKINKSKYYKVTTYETKQTGWMVPEKHVQTCTHKPHPIHIREHTNTYTYVNIYLHHTHI